MEDGRMGVRQYAVKRGVRLSTVQAAVKTGRITLDADGLINPITADREWEANTSPERRKPSRSEIPPPPEHEPLGPLDYAKERAVREHWAAKRERLEYEKEVRLVVPASEIEDAWVKAAQTVRSHFLRLPSKARQELPHLVAEDIAVLDRLVRDVLEELCQQSES